jgi:transposase
MAELKRGRPGRIGEVKQTTVYLDREQRINLNRLKTLSLERRDVELESNSDAVGYSLGLAVECLSSEPTIKKMATRPVN